MAKFSAFYPKSHGRPWGDDRRILGGIIFINRNGLKWRDAPEAYGPHKTQDSFGSGILFRQVQAGNGAELARIPCKIELSRSPPQTPVRLTN
ncbi:putative transposase of IS4/5 family DUF4096 [Ruegeria conchae]|uniref:Putative transposase of IS4/5 family DUF4096 n=1 Tax=Ruegeria conchae TaxID=981384 RepID=A0A497ZQV5_9RHOB|nr:putative transposase of IS4/5 family DUF4096 [Ruegeria conchae]